MSCLLISGGITPDEFQITEHLTKRAIKAANRLIRHLESTSDPIS